MSHRYNVRCVQVATGFLREEKRSAHSAESARPMRDSQGGFENVPDEAEECPLTGKARDFDAALDLGCMTREGEHGRQKKCEDQRPCDLRCASSGPRVRVHFDTAVASFWLSLRFTDSLDMK